jgi:hypothetical protein
MGTAMIIFNGPQSGLMSGCKIGPGAPSAESWKYKHANVADVLIGIGAIFIAITRMMKVLVMNF